MLIESDKILDIPSVEKLWRISAISEGFVFSKNPSTVTAVCYFPPIYAKATENIECEINTFLETFESVNEGTVLSIYFFKQSKDWLLEAQTDSSHECINYLEEKRIDLINETLSPEYHIYISITMPVKSEGTNKGSIFKDLFSSPSQSTNQLLHDDNFIESCNSAINNIKNLISQLQSKFYSQCYQLSSKQLADFVGNIINHSTKNNLSDLSSILTSDIFSNNKEGTTYYGGNFHKTLSLRPEGFPEQAEFELPLMYFDDQLKDIPFIIKADIHFPDRIKANKSVRVAIGKINFYAAIAKAMMKELVKEAEQMEETLDEVVRKSKRLLDVSFSILTWADNTKSLDINVNDIKNHFKSKSVDLKEDFINHKATYHSFIPWLANLNKITTRISSINAGVFLPIVYPHYYVNDPSKEIENRTLFYTTADVLTEYDLMDKRNPNSNGIICGTSGFGKSFLVNYLIQNHLKSNGKVFIIDKGGPGQGSFKNIVNNIPNGRYIEIDFFGDSNFTVNFFDGPLFFNQSEDGSILTPDINGTVDVLKLNFLLQVITLMAKDDAEERFSKTVEHRLRESIRQMYIDTFNNEANTIDLDYFADNVLADKFPEIYEQIQVFLYENEYSKFFKKTTNMDTVDVFCFDLEGLDQHPDLKSIMIFVMTQYCYSMCRKNPGVRKGIFIDEAWAALNSSQMAGLIVDMWRTIRKHFGFIYLISQSLNDVYSTKIAAALTVNTTHYYLLGPNHDHKYLDQLRAVGANSNFITDYDKACIQDMKFVKGKFSEFFLLTPLYKGVLRYKASAYDKWLNTTDPRDKKIIDVYKEKYSVKYVTREVLEDLVNNE